MKFFTPEQKTINDLFTASSRVTYNIPPYQRLYSWEARGKSDRDSQVNTMWDDLIEHFKVDKNQYYFMGSMVHINKGIDVYEVVDGQQRLTTLSLLFVAIKCFLQNIDEQSIISSNLAELKEDIDKATREMDKILFKEKSRGTRVVAKKIKIQRSGGFDYDAVLRAAFDCIQTYDVKTSSLEEKRTVDRFFDNRNYFIEQLKGEFLDNDKFTDECFDELDEFVHFLRERVLIIRILCQDVDVAYQVFEILNNRRLPLSNKDLFRNFLIKELTRENIENAEQKWLELDDNYEFSTEFLSRYVESTNGQKQRKSAFSDVDDIYRKFVKPRKKSKIEAFYDDIEKNLLHYSNIELLDFDNIEIKHRVEFLKNSGNSRYVNNLLLSLFRNISDENKLSSFLKEFEIFVLYQLLGPSKRFQSSVLFAAINALNDNDFTKALQEITISTTEKNDLKSLLIQSNIIDNSLAKLIIARYFWAKQIKEEDDVVQLTLDFNNRKTTLEHIIPQKPKLKSNWLTDFSKTFRDNYTYKLGNMTLLTNIKNSRAKNHGFEKKKKDVYSKVKLPMTLELCQIDTITEQHIIDRHDNITTCLIEHFGL